MPVVRWMLAAVVGATLVLAGAGKLVDPVPTARVVLMVGIPSDIARFLLMVLPGLEFALGVALILGWQSRALVTTVIGLLTAFTLFLVFLARADYTADCSCTGLFVESWSGGGPLWAIARNLLLLGLLIWPATHIWQAKCTVTSNA